MRRPWKNWGNLFVVSCLPLLGTVTSCASQSGYSTQVDSPYYATCRALTKASQFALRIDVSAHAGNPSVQGVKMNSVKARIISSFPSISKREIYVLVPYSPGLSEYIDLKVGNEYVIYVNSYGTSEVILVSPDQGVFPVSNGVVGPSRLGPFSIGANTAGELGLQREAGKSN